MEFLALTFALLVRAFVGLHPHSGEHSPPMFGDFEAQRHWMEVTVNLPIGDWYRQTVDNDLQYWGLDYPPLTAYLSWVFGKVAASWGASLSPLIALRSSRGHESVAGKAYMRGTVLLMDLLVLLPAVVLLSRALTVPPKKNSPHQPKLVAMAALFSLPSILLIDHGHFQYNGVCIGLALWAALYLHRGQEISACILFCLSLNFKQMALYFAPVFFFALLRKAVVEERSFSAKLTHLAALGITVLGTFALLWAPFCIYSQTTEESCASSLLHVLKRQFPFERGIFEDKVANLWYAASRVIDPRTFMSQTWLLRASLALTLVFLAPTAICLMRCELTLERLLLALVNSALAFFLASFQVHEKSLLLALVPAAFFIFFQTAPVPKGRKGHSGTAGSSNDDNAFKLLAVWFQVFGCFTMFPLLRREGLATAYVACNLLFLGLVLTSGYIEGLEDVGAGARVETKSKSVAPLQSAPIVGRLQRGFVIVSTVGAVALHLAELFVSPPLSKPHLYPALISVYGAANLSVFFAFTLYKQQCSYR